MNLQIQGYQQPPKAIKDLIDAPSTPGVSINPARTLLLLMGRPSLPSIEEVAQPELRLAGIRINPRTNGSSRAGYYNSLTLKSIKTGEEIDITGLPHDSKIQNVSWSPKSDKIAFTITVADGMELWIADVLSASAKKFTPAIINDTMSGSPYIWLADGQYLIFKSILKDRGEAPKEPLVPLGPTIQESNGVEAAVRTYQDLLKNKFDEDLFEYYTTSQLVKIHIDNGDQQPLGKSGIIRSFSPSPDGNYLLVLTTRRPFSYLVPYSKFPFTVDIWDISGNKIKEIANIPAAEDIPKGFGATRKGRRSFMWRLDQPATLYWVEAQDEGNPRIEVAVRDKLYFLKAPFQSSPTEHLSFALRFGGISWCDGNLAISREWWWQNRREITKAFAPDDINEAADTLFDRSWEDQYNNPGTFQLQRNLYGRSILLKEGEKLFLTGQGASVEGNKPFIDEYNLKTKTTKRLWQSAPPYYEVPLILLDAKALKLLTAKESVSDNPNFFIRHLKNEKTEQITHFPNVYKALKEVKKELIKYKREDGIDLTGTLYLPAGYNAARDGRLPVLMWAYPREYKSKDTAGQVKDSPYRFIRIGAHSPIYWVTQGYAVFDNFGMPIIGEGEEEPNETFLPQLVAGAKAAIDILDQMGVADKNRIAVGGHSYGAFMTANLLAHSGLFAAGIARSGAFNRTLTPFGFQSEERTFWEAPDVYMKMSPFTHADKIKAPLLLIHGEADNNSGTYPMQSERFYAALKGHGASARLVMLPHESHSYRARESLLHMLWEMDTWLKKYV